MEYLAYSEALDCCWAEDSPLEVHQKAHDSAFLFVPLLERPNSMDHSFFGGEELESALYFQLVEVVSLSANSIAALAGHHTLRWIVGVPEDLVGNLMARPHDSWVPGGHFPA